MKDTTVSVRKFDELLQETGRHAEEYDMRHTATSASFMHRPNKEKATECVDFRHVPNILFVFYLVRIVGRIMYFYSAEFSTNSKQI